MREDPKPGNLRYIDKMRFQSQIPTIDTFRLSKIRRPRMASSLDRTRNTTYTDYHQASPDSRTIPDPTPDLPTMVHAHSWSIVRSPPVSNLPHLDSPWLDSTRTFLAHSRSQIIIPSLPSPKPFRQNDQIIMDMVIRLSLSAGQVKKINYCRLFLQVTSLSEITNLEGKHIDLIAWTGSTRIKSHHDWPRQGRPGSRTWALWRNAITDAFCQQPDECVRLMTLGLLDCPLGSWLPGSRLFQLW
jgi:hypothetical protein